ncbi:sugar phosphate isomerase/epimerase family protein [Kitasatospora sp. NPDC057015]|uniref:sugar phosphate isomerase/epimerase family protein n=1 Tax=Kitasatospora sp. NPDC057015 TaxID=3346001 RepID=UPI00363BAD9C
MTATTPLAVQLYGLDQAMTADRHDTLRRLAAMGYTGVEPYDILSDPHGLRADLDEFGLRACSVHAWITGEQQDEILRALPVVGADTVILPYAAPERFADRAAVAALAGEINAAVRAAAEHGIRVGYHNHEFELSTLLDGVPALEVLADLLDPAVVLEVDTYWAAAGGQDVPALLRRLGDRVRHLHVKDGPVTVDREQPNVAVGSGRMPVPAILAAAPAAEWHIVELDQCATDLFDAMAQSHTYLTTKGVR